MYYICVGIYEYIHYMYVCIYIHPRFVVWGYLIRPLVFTYDVCVCACMFVCVRACVCAYTTHL